MILGIGSEAWHAGHGIPSAWLAATLPAHECLAGGSHKNSESRCCRVCPSCSAAFIACLKSAPTVQRDRSKTGGIGHASDLLDVPLHKMAEFR